MTPTSKTASSDNCNAHSERKIAASLGQIVLVFQGGGALGAYQAGVYQALHENGIEPDWVIGTSIGAINAALIAGNEPGNRLPALQTFWERVAQRLPRHAWSDWPHLNQLVSNMTTLASGVPGFFEPNPLAFCGSHIPLGADSAGYYATKPLERTLRELVDFSLIEHNSPRLTVGTAHVRTSTMRYFDSRDTEIGVEHIMASGALPPGFPAVRIEGNLYWDGGILSNTPAEAIFDDKPRRNSVVFAAQLWNPNGPEPETIRDVMHRQGDIQFSSRVATHIALQQRIHRLRHIINELAVHVPDAVQRRKEIREMTAYGCVTRMHFVRLLAPSIVGEDQTKVLDFSPESIGRRWTAGYEKTLKAIELAPWRGEFDPLEGVVLHDLDDDGQTDNTGNLIQDRDSVTNASRAPAYRGPAVHPTQ